MRRVSRSRSRSPLARTDGSARLASALLELAEHAEKRPAGLHVDSSGAMLVKDLMRTWGRQQGIRERDLLHGVRAHMFHDGDPGDPNGLGQLQFAIDSDDAGQLLIRMHPRRAPRARLGARAAPTRMRGSALLQMAAPQNGASAAEASQQHLRQRLELSLDEVMDADAASASERNKEDRLATEQRVKQALEQMGLTTDSRHVRRAIRGVADALEGGDRRLDPRLDRLDGGDRRSSNRSLGEQVQRWLGWVLQSGFRDLALPLNDGWAKLDDLAEAMGKTMPKFGLFDGDRLQVLLRESDTAGRFEFDGSGQVRKVARGGRTPRGGPAPPPPSTLPVGTPPPPPPQAAVAAASSRAAPTAQSGAPSRGAPFVSPFIPNARARSPSPTPGRDLDDAALASVCQRALRVSGDVTLDAGADGSSGGAGAASGGDTAAALARGGAAAAQQEQVRPAGAGAGSGGGQPPPPPPGPGWTMYQENKSYWWHYDGPLGSWWCPDKNKLIEPYEG